MSRTLHFILIAVLFAGCEARDGEQQRPNQSTNAGPTTMTTVDPKDILFSLSTLNDELPPVAGSAVEGDGHCRMHEDNWRQFEFVSASHHAEVAAELEAIEGIWKQYSVSVGEGMTAFREVHVRKRLPKPIDVPMSRAGFENLAGGPSRAMTFFDGKILQGVHAARLPGVIVYAVIWNDRMIAPGADGSFHDRRRRRRSA